MKKVIKLGEYLKHQKFLYKRGLLKLEKIKELEALGIKWDESKVKTKK